MMSISPLMPVYPRCGVRPVRGEHCHLIDEDGTRYLDFASGIAVNLLGHSHEGLISAIQQQAATLMHVSNLYGSPQGERLAQQLVNSSFADTVFFTNSGAEAVEGAIKAARAYHQNAGDARCPGGLLIGRAIAHMPHLVGFQLKGLEGKLQGLGVGFGGAGLAGDHHRIELEIQA